MRDSWIRTLMWILGIVGAICFLLYLFVFDVWTVPRSDPQFTASVLPTLMPDDKILIQRGRVPRAGELARCASPVTAGTFIIGRVFGEPGDLVQVTDRIITTNGKPSASRHACPQMTVVHPISEALIQMNCGVVDTGAFTYQYLAAPDMNGGEHSAHVENGKLYLVSDNRLMHQDSRDFGQVDASTCEHVVFRLWGERFTDGSRRFNVVW